MVNDGLVHDGVGNSIRVAGGMQRGIQNMDTISRTSGSLLGWETFR